MDKIIRIIIVAAIFVFSSIGMAGVIIEDSPSDGGSIGLVFDISAAFEGGGDVMSLFGGAQERVWEGYEPEFVILGDISLDVDYSDDDITQVVINDGFIDFLGVGLFEVEAGIAGFIDFSTSTFELNLTGYSDDLVDGHESVGRWVFAGIVEDHGVLSGSFVGMIEVPEPATIAILGLGGVLLCRKR